MRSGLSESKEMCLMFVIGTVTWWGEYSKVISRAKKINQNNSYLMKYREEVINPLTKIEYELIDPMNSYFLCKKDLAESEKVMDMVRLSLSNGETLEEVAKSMFNIQKAAKLIAGGKEKS